MTLFLSPPPFPLPESLSWEVIERGQLVSVSWLDELQTWFFDQGAVTIGVASVLIAWLIHEIRQKRNYRLRCEAFSHAFVTLTESHYAELSKQEFRHAKERVDQERRHSLELESSLNGVLSTLEVALTKEPGG